MPTKFSKKQVIIILGAVVLVIVVLFALYFGLRPKAQNAQAVKLNVWGVEDSQVFGTLVSTYPYGQVKYTQVDPANYEAQLLSALAAGTGPDVFEIGNRDLAKWKAVLAPFPTSSATFGLLQLSQLFPDVVGQDFVSDGQIYGLPISIDTLAMVYNKDLFNSAGIALPPKTWDEFDNDVTRLRAVNASGQITQAAAAIGGSEASVANAPDILSLLMLQNGTQMNDENSWSTVGANAFNFYLQFANAASPYYTWNDAMGNALDSFAAGKTAIVFAYQSDLATIKAKAPFLNFGIAPMPQPSGSQGAPVVAVNYPKYQGFVAAKAGQQIAAWNFILYVAALSGTGKSYGVSTGAPPALRTDIAADLADPNLSVFASQALTAKSWNEGDSVRAEAALNAAIANVLNGAEDPAKALREAQTTVSQLTR